MEHTVKIKHDDCEICCDSDNPIIQCAHCNVKTCLQCLQYYFLSTMNDPHCVKCKVVWSPMLIRKTLPKTYICKELKKHRENILFDREKALLPSTQPAVEHILNIRRLNVIIKYRKQLLRRLRNNMDARSKDKKKLQDRNKEIFDINLQLQDEIVMSKSSLNMEEMHRVCIRPCPNENCRGFLDEEWRCKLCDTNVCKKCNTVIDTEEHKCKKENIESAKLIENETHPCPKCGVRIFKSDGCDQLFCTSCHTAFSWKTGEIERGRIHNPHYYEWLNRGGGVVREVGDVQCGGIPLYSEIKDILCKLKMGIIYYVELSDIHKILIHIEDVSLHYNLIARNDNEKLRIKYIMKEIDENKFKYLVQIREKKRDKTVAVREVLSMFVTAGGDLYRNILAAKARPDLYLIINELTQLIHYTNTCLDEIYKLFGGVVPYILKDNYGVFFIENFNRNIKIKS